MNIMMIFFKIIRFLRLFRLCKMFNSNFSRFFENLEDIQMGFAFDVGKGFVTGEEEVLEILPQMIDNEKIRKDIRQKMEMNRLVITRQLGIVQKDSPWIAVTVKTRQAVRTILNSMKDAIDELKFNGWVDEIDEYAKLMESLADRVKSIRNIRTMSSSAPKQIFEGVPWLENDKKITEFLWANVYTKVFNPGDLVCYEGEVTEGIFILLTGILKLNYNPRIDILNNITEFGCLPILDYISNSTFNEVIAEYVVSGNCVGELSTLTGRPYNCTIIAETYSQVYVLSREVIQLAIKLSNDTIYGLESRIWKSISNKLALSILINVPSHQSETQDQIKYVLAQSFVPNLSGYKIFGINEMMEDIILIEGAVADFTTRDIYIAPCYIPRNVHKVILPTSSLMKFSTKIMTRILIIPGKETDKYDLMEEGHVHETTTVMSTTKCLQHGVITNKAKIKKHKETSRLQPKALLSSDKVTFTATREKSSQQISNENDSVI